MNTHPASYSTLNLSFYTFSTSLVFDVYQQTCVKASKSCLGMLSFYNVAFQISLFIVMYLHLIVYIIAIYAKLSDELK